MPDFEWRPLLWHDRAYAEEKRWHLCPLTEEVINKKLVSVVFVDDEGRRDGKVSKSYPLNPNGSPFGIAGLCTQDGRHLAMMPHPERTFLKWQWPWMPSVVSLK